MPFDFGYVGIDVVCINSHLFLKSLNSLLLNCGPLSDITVFGVLCRAMEQLRKPTTRFTKF